MENNLAVIFNIGGILLSRQAVHYMKQYQAHITSNVPRLEKGQLENMLWYQC